MTRVNPGNAEVIEVKPSNNVYTALVVIAVVAQIVAIVALVIRSAELFEKGVFA